MAARNAEQPAADARFLAENDKTFNGNRKMANPK
jgi:hypothetical protein